MIRILQLNASTEKKLLRARQFRDTEAERIAAKIIADVRHRGDAALFAWTKNFDRLNLNSKNIWLPCTGAALLRPKPRPNPRSPLACSSSPH
jgi:histidinol dehydrogenase